MALREKKRVLFGELLRTVVSPVLAELGATKRGRIEQVIQSSVNEQIRLSDCLALFPAVDAAVSLKTLTNLRSNFNRTARELGVDVQFLADSSRRTSPAERFCWFEGADPAVAQATKFSDELTADILNDPLVKPRGIVTTGSAMAANKRVVRFFVSYAHDDRELAERLIKEFRVQFGPSRRYELALWDDRNIMVGERWHQRIQQGIGDCDFGLLLVSPAFLGSEYIGAHELPHFVGAGNKPVIPVGLVRVDFGNHDLKGLSDHQIFMKGGQFFASRRATEDKRQFVHDLYLETEKRLNQWLNPAADSSTRRRGDGEAPTPDGGNLEKQLPVPDATRDFQRPRGFATTLAGLATLEGNTRAHEQARDAIEELEAWAVAADAPPFFALLGEYGIGKTTTLKQFTRHLLGKLKDPQAAVQAARL
jgi:hypothetical protein